MLYEVIDLGTFGDASYANAINGSGQVVGLSGKHPFLFDGKTMIDISVLGANAISSALDINDVGHIVGTAEVSGNGQAFYFDGTSVTVLAGPISSAYGINDNDQVVGIAPANTLYPTEAALFENAGVTDLGQGEARDISSTGMIVGATKDNLGVLRAGFYTAGLWTNIDLGPLNWTPGSIAIGVNKYGHIVGTLSLNTGGPVAFFYESGSSLTILTPLPPWLNLNATALNVWDSVVGRGSILTRGVTHAFVWDVAAGIRDLNDLIQSNSGWELTAASDINDNGQIVGSGLFYGQMRAFRLDPVMYRAPFY